MNVGAYIRYLRAVFQQRRLEDELDGEIRAHLELAERENIAAGMTPEEACRAARRNFGGIEQMKEEHREQRGMPWMETLLRDLRYGLAALLRDPGFAAIAIGVLALGTGANTAVFSLVDAVLLQPLPFPNPERIVRVWEAPRPGVTNSTSTLDFLDWKQLATSFEALAAEQSISVALTGEGEPARMSGRAVTSDYFKVFIPEVQLGRTFTPQEDQPGSAPVTVLSHRAWQTYFGGDRQILGRELRLDGEAHQVIGVLSPGVFDRDQAEFWKPLVFTPDQQTRDYHWLTVHGRLHRDATLAQAREQMRAIDEALADVTPAFKQDWTVVVEPFDRLLVGDSLHQSIIIAFGAVVAVLLIACANVANLLLARGAARRKEMAVRAALGAGRGRLVAQLLSECLVLCLLGGATGLAVAALLIRAAEPVLAESIPYTATVGLNLPVLAFAAAAVLGVTLLVGALPALQTSLGRLSNAMNQSTRGSSGGHKRIRHSIVIGEVALSLVLVCGAVLLFRSLFNLQELETGIQIENVITVSVDLPRNDYPAPESAARFYDALAQQLENAPGVSRAALTSHLPLRWIANGQGLSVPGVDQPINVRFKPVDPGYFDTLRIPLLSGRGITDRDRAGAPGVIVINEALAARLTEVTGRLNHLGQGFRLGVPSYEAKRAVATNVQVAGIIRGERVNAPGRSDPPVVYVPLAQAPTPDIKIIARTLADPASVVPTIREAVRRVDPNLPLGDVATMQQVRERTLEDFSRPAWVIGVFATVAAWLAALGLYGVLAHSVTQQRREIGIRMALGAQSGDVLSHVLRNGLSMVGVGLMLGLAGSFALTRVMESLLFQVSPLDPVALTAACVAMTLIGLLAGFVPAKRAARVNPMAVLRDES